jgi:hypothetical protein
MSSNGSSKRKAKDEKIRYRKLLLQLRKIRLRPKKRGSG